MRYVIIGGGIAGTTAAEEIRKLDPVGEITLISEEQHAVYSRVLLPHYLKGKIPRERVFLKKEFWYAEKNIEWLRGEFVTHLDVNNTFVTISSGREIEYDRLLIATGGEIRTLPFDRRGVSYFRTLDDADHLAQLLRERAPTDQAGIYGGGFIACEYVNLFAHYQIPTEIALRGHFFWSQMLVEEAGELIHQQLETHGVTIQREADVEQVVQDPRFQIVGVGIGIEPDIHFLKQSGIELGRGVRTNEFLETNIPHIYSVGDVTEFYDVITGRHVQAGNWMNAMTQGRVVAKSMTGQRTVFELVSSYSTNILGLEIIFVGDTSKAHADNIALLGSLKEGGVTQLFERENRLVGGVMIGRNTDRARITQAIKERTNY